MDTWGKLAKEMRKFIEDIDLEKGMGDTGPHLVAWEDVCKLKWNDGLGSKGLEM